MASNTCSCSGSWEATETVPLVSVIMPVYNAARYLEEAVASVVREQSKHSLELLLVEDCSKDGSLALCRRLAEQHPGVVRLFQHPDCKNHGANASRNLGIAKARGALVVFLDSDDYWVPGRLDRAVEILSGAPDVDGVVESIAVAFEPDAAQADRQWFTGLLGPPPDATAQALACCPSWRTSGIVLRKRALEVAGVFDTRFIIGDEDHLWFRVAATCKLAVGVVGRPVAMYRRHAGSLYSVGSHPQLFEMYWDLCMWASSRGLPRHYTTMLHKRLLASLYAGEPSASTDVLAQRARRLLAMATAFPGVLSLAPFYRALAAVVVLRPLWPRSWRSRSHSVRVEG